MNPEEKEHSLFEEVDDGFYETDLEGNLRCVNESFCRILGRSLKEVKGENLGKFMDKENASAAFNAPPGQDRFLWQIVRPDGSRRFLEVSARPLYDENGKKTGFRGIARDITRQHEATKAIEKAHEKARNLYSKSKAAERRYRALLNFLPDPVFVFNMDQTVAYLNPAFERVFGWSLDELEGRKIPFVPDECKEQTKKGIEKLFAEKVIHGFETRRLTKDGRLLDIVIDGAIFYDEKGEPAGQIITLRDVTSRKRAERLNRTLFNIASALHRYREIDDLLFYVTKEIQNLLNVGGALVILLDEEKHEFFFRAAAYEDQEAEKRYREVRFPADKGVTGQVLRTKKPIIIHDYYKSPYSFFGVDKQTGSKTRNMLQVPLWVEGRMIGVLCAVNKKAGTFEPADIDLLTTVAGIVALPIENARINHELMKSYKKVKSLNSAKDRVIHHLSHELKTPVSVLSASLAILEKKKQLLTDPSFERILERSKRNLKRILEIQYRAQDIIKGTGDMLKDQLMGPYDSLTERVTAIVRQACGERADHEKIKKLVIQHFGPEESGLAPVILAAFVQNTMAMLKKDFSHRKLTLFESYEKTPPVYLPKDVLGKIITGLVKNAVENTPDGGSIRIGIEKRPDGPRFFVTDHGTGITEDNQRLVFNSIFSASETSDYSTKRPYDFYAGGSGFDLLRMKIFSERYGFEIGMNTTRCRFIPADSDLCPGNIAKCVHISDEKDCLKSGGSTFYVQFSSKRPAGSSRNPEKQGSEDVF